MKKEFTVKGLKDLKAVAEQLLKEKTYPSVWAFYGEMGAGKTSLIQQLGNVLRVKELVASPTFNLINEYETNSGQLVYHFDFYRIEDIEEAMNIGTLEYFDSDNLCLLEWPEKIESLLPETRRNLYIRVTENEKRIIKVEDNE